MRKEITWQDLATPGRLSVEEGQLLLDGTPLAEGRIIAFRYGESELLPGRIQNRPKIGWYLTLQEFIGHTYLNMPLSKNVLKDIQVFAIDNPQESI